ncbi:MAG: AbrB/MazE/SpoVT family DNA-binding domain-containing protein [Nanoarchaeota archaeon]
MKRKIIGQGHNTLTITLPSKWARKLNLKAGEEVDIEESGSRLILNTSQHPKEKSCVIDIRNFTVPLLWRYFQSVYRAGCDEIKVLFDPEKKKYEDAFHYYTTQFEYRHLGEKVPPKPAIAVIQEIVGRFVGIEIIENGKDYCIIREMGEVSPKEFENSLRRIFLIILELFDRTIKAIENNEIKDSSLCKEIHAIDLSIDKFVDYCARILNKIVGVCPEEKKQLMFSSLFILELVGDEFKYIAKHLALSKKPVKECLAIANLVKEHFELYYRIYYKFDRELTIKWGQKDIEVYKTHFSTKDGMHGECRSIMRHFMMVSKLTLALVELRIQMEF